VGGAISTSTRVGDGAERRPTATTRSLLIVDCGSVFTKVVLLGKIEDRYRLIARAQAPTTVTPPLADLTAGLHEALAAIERATGRALLRDGQLLTPERDDGAGVDGLALATSVNGPLRVLATGPGRDALAGLVQLSVGGLFIQLEALPALPVQATGTPEWQQALAQLRAFQPHALLVVGSPFAGGRSPGSIEKTAALSARWLDSLGDPLGGDEQRSLPVIVCGSPADASVMSAAVQGRASTVQAVEALSPSTLSPLNRAVSALYEGAVLRDLPNYAGLRALSKVPPAATITALAGMVRYLAQHFQTNVVGVDVGASATSLAGATARGEFLPAVQPSAGVGPGAGAVLRAAGAPAILRWISGPVSEDELREYVLTRMLRRRSLPATGRELELEHALARETIGLALRAPGARLAGLHPMDVVLGTGGVLANVPHPALAALILLDALQPRGITSLVLDTAHLSGALGSVAGLDPSAAADVAEGDAVLLQLGTVVSAVGNLPEGEPALQAVLEYPDGRRHVEEVAQGTLVRLPLSAGEQALLGLYPVPSVDVGLGPGQRARASEPVEGGALGLIVDARGRPLALPAADDERIARLAAWRRALGLETA
jgi:MutL-like protein